MHVNKYQIHFVTQSFFEVTVSSYRRLFVSQDFIQAFKVYRNTTAEARNQNQKSETSIHNHEKPNKCGNLLTTGKAP